MFLQVRNHLIDVDIMRHVTVLPPVLVIDIGNTEDIQIDFATAEEARATFDAISASLQAQSTDAKIGEENKKTIYIAPPSKSIRHTLDCPHAKNALPQCQRNFANFQSFPSQYHFFSASTDG